MIFPFSSFLDFILLTWRCYSFILLILCLNRDCRHSDFRFSSFFWRPLPPENRTFRHPKFIHKRFAWLINWYVSNNYMLNIYIILKTIKRLLAILGVLAYFQTNLQKLWIICCTPTIYRYIKNTEEKLLLMKYLMTVNESNFGMPMLLVVFGVTNCASRRQTLGCNK